MTQTQHTKAPWRIEGQSIFGNEINGFICSWSGYKGDAHLIAAAPDMLAFIEAFAGGEFNTMADAIEAAFVVIKKARG